MATSPHSVLPHLLQSFLRSLAPMASTDQCSKMQSVIIQIKLNAGKIETTVCQTPMSVPEQDYPLTNCQACNIKDPLVLLNGAHGPPTCNVPRSRLSNERFEGWAQRPNANGYGCGSLGSDLSHDPTQVSDRRRTGRRCLTRRRQSNRQRSSRRWAAGAAYRSRATRDRATHLQINQVPKAPWKTAARPVKGT